MLATAAAAAAGGAAPRCAHFLPAGSAHRAVAFRWCSTAPGVRTCLALLHLQQGASPEDVKKAFRKAARRHHPDTAVGGSFRDSAGDFVRLYECYQLLLLMAPSVEPGSGLSPESTSTGTPTSPRRRRGNLSPWEAARAAAYRSGTAAVAVPSIIAVVVPAAISGAACGAPGFCGLFRRTMDFNGMPAYVGRGLRYYLFWSDLFLDWKIGERLSEKTPCVAFLDGRRDAPPWTLAVGPGVQPQQPPRGGSGATAAAKAAANAAASGLMWNIWNAHHRCFENRALLVRPLDGDML